MNPKVSEFLEKYHSAMSEYGRFLFYSRGIEFQKYSIEKLTAFRKALVGLKEEMIEATDEESANTLLSLEYLVNTHINELEMLVFLKEDKMEDAWEALVKAQYSLRASFQASDIVLELNGYNYMNKLHLIEKLFFPPQTFTSIELVVEKIQCSICNKEYGSCNHVVGKPYNGRLCHKVITKIKEAKGLAILVNREPGNKLCRITSLSDEGHWRNIMTWRITKS